MAKTNFIQSGLFDKGVRVKKCTRCGERKPRDEFYKRRASNGRMYNSARCKPCEIICRKQWDALNPDYVKLNRHQMVCRRFGITPQEYEEMLRRQGGVCVLCGNPETKTGKGGKLKRLAVDHDHETGRIRSLLCMECNSGIGKLKDNPALLRTAADYIEHHRKLHEDDPQRA